VGTNSFFFWNAECLGKRFIRTRLAVFLSILLVVQLVNIVYSQPVGVPGVSVLVGCRLRCLCHDLNDSRYCANDFIFEKMLGSELLCEA